MLFSLILGHFWCSVVNSVTLGSNLSNYDIFNKKKFSQKFQNLKKSKKNQENPIKKILQENKKNP